MLKEGRTTEVHAKCHQRGCRHNSCVTPPIDIQSLQQPTKNRCYHSYEIIMLQNVYGKLVQAKIVARKIVVLIYLETEDILPNNIESYRPGKIICGNWKIAYDVYEYTIQHTTYTTYDGDSSYDLRFGRCL